MAAQAGSHGRNRDFAVLCLPDPGGLMICGKCRRVCLPARGPSPAGTGHGLPERFIPEGWVFLPDDSGFFMLHERPFFIKGLCANAG
jgi:hypothetical protein